MNVENPILAILFLIVLAGDAIACSIPIAYIKQDLDRLNVPESTQRILGPIKGAASVGLLIGLWVPFLGLISALGVVGYFVAAIQVHLRQQDDPIRYVPAVLFLVAACAVARFCYVPGS